ncbi:hypothetical protein UWK_02300 [Desulfocapsa sulfexigens DSM 10523]|uniref:Uncharacterized protein n=1 Tax=Desulfocapsa sulfexigens (strain DSM 10523 / SB164P1) TaxID=1167006 RepID=M1PGT0_DESSD|nr:hypothetical protein [Desulfocapsa sulfexigens]AGF78840.1 hypothetical protein UWK_02300 [Desulfocapsa sulfexigens DSM 10523]
MELKDEWDLASAMKVLKHQTVDARLWAEAVEWLILYGPDDVREILLASSGTATHECFPDLQAKGYAPDGQPCYRVEDLARNLDISEDEARKMIQEKEKAHKLHHFIDEEDTMKVQ